MRVVDRLCRLYGVGEDWVRPVRRRSALRSDGILAVLMTIGALISVETTRSLGTLDTAKLGLVGTYLWIAVPVLTLGLRRVLPLTLLVIAVGHYLVTAAYVPEVSPVFALQVYYFFTLFSAVAWSAHRRAALVLTCVMAAASIGWVLAEVLLHDVLETLRLLPHVGLFSPPAAVLGQAFISVCTFFLASSLGGTATWWSARREDQARERGLTIAEQADRLRHRSVTEERLRIARELHDVVGHHIALIGIQTGAARAVLGTAPDEAATAMRHAEEASRTATRDLRLLLNALRVQREAGEEVATNGSLRTLPDLLETFEALGLEVDYRPRGPLDEVPAAVALSTFRVVQEALTNVCRHSTATTSEVDVVVSAPSPRGGAVTVRVVDPGPSRGDTSGSRMGIVGMRERVTLHGGTLDVAPDDEGGFVVEAELVWDDCVTTP